MSLAVALAYVALIAVLYVLAVRHHERRERKRFRRELDEFLASIGRLER